MNEQFPLWSLTAWWVEFKKGSPEYNQRYADFRRMVREKGLPVILMKNCVPVKVVFATHDCDKEVNFGSQEAPEIKTVCRWCGQEQSDFLRFIREVEESKGKKDGPIPKGTKTGALVRIVRPEHPDTGFVDSTTGWTWGRCPHIYAWKLEPQKAGRGTKGTRFSCFLLF